MPLPVDTVVSRPGSPRLDLTLRLLCGTALLSMGVSGCSVWTLWDDPAPPAPPPAPPVVVAAAPIPVVPPVAPPPAPHERVTPTDLAARRALAAHELVRTLSPPELAQEINRLAALPASPEVAIDLALALMQTRNGGELTRAIGLIEPLARGTAPETPQALAAQPVARLLLARLLDMRRLEDLLDKRNQELRDSQREVKQLNEKLEALKAIERSLEPRSSAPMSSPLANSPAGSLNVTIRKPQSPAASSTAPNGGAPAPALAPKRAPP